MAVTDQALSAIVVAGNATMTFRPTSNRTVYTVQQVTVDYPTAPIGCTCEIRKNGSLVTPMIPTGDAAGGDPPVPLKGNDRMTIEFRNATNGEIVNAFVIYDDGTKE